VPSKKQRPHRLSADLILYGCHPRELGLRINEGILKCMTDTTTSD
jgi:hypothetical protein